LNGDDAVEPAAGFESLFEDRLDPAQRQQEQLLSRRSALPVYAR
jgi:hypothetical protein